MIVRGGVQTYGTQLEVFGTWADVRVIWRMMSLSLVWLFARGGLHGTQVS